MAGLYVVNPHDHAYGFVTMVLAGTVVNQLFDEYDHSSDGVYESCESMDVSIASRFQRSKTDSTVRRRLEKIRCR